jgi:hypothetical protein
MARHVSGDVASHVAADVANHVGTDVDVGVVIFCGHVSAFD